MPANGPIGIMSSGQGGVSSSEKGGHEVYRDNKVALNQCMGSCAARHVGEPRTLVLMAPGLEFQFLSFFLVNKERGARRAL